MQLTIFPSKSSTVGFASMIVVTILFRASLAFLARALDIGPLSP